MKNSKFYSILALVALVFIGDRVGGELLKILTGESQFRYSRLYRGDAGCDILLVGNSRGLIFYQPYIEEFTNQKSFNVSYNGLPIDLARVLIEDHFDHHAPPKLMLIDITICDRTNKELIAGFNLYSPLSPRLDTLLETNVPKAFYGGLVSHLYRYNGEVFQRVLYYLNKLDEDWLLDRAINEKVVEAVVEQPAYSIDLQPYLLEQLVEIVHYAKEKGVEVRLVINPYFPPFAEKITNIKQIIEKVETATGLEVFDYSISVNDPKAFADYQHLNKYGSKLFIDQLVKDGIFQ